MILSIITVVLIILIPFSNAYIETVERRKEEKRNS